MFNFLGRLFGSDKAVSKTLETATGLLDDVFYTDAEKAEDRAKERQQVQGFIIDWLKTTSTSNLARRIIAVSITGSWLLTHMISSGIGVAAIWFDEPETHARLMATTALLDNRIDGMTGAVMLILGFYFAAPYMGDMVKGAMGRFSQSTQVKP